MDDAKRFLEGLQRQQVQYREMLVLAREQVDIVGAADMDALLKLLDRKRGLMGEIEKVEKEISEVKARWPELRGSAEETTVRQVEQAIGETRMILEELVRLEEEGRRAMERRKDTTADELKGLWQKKKVRDAYGGGVQKKPGDPRFYDDKK